MSIRQAEEVVALVNKLGLPLNGPWEGRPVVVVAPGPPFELRGGVRLTLLSPRAQEMDRFANSWEKSLRGGLDSSDVDPDEPLPRAEEDTGAGPLVYISSSHKDEQWRDQLRQALASLLPGGHVLWSTPPLDQEARGPSDDWEEWRRNAIQRARVGVVLVSPDALGSSWVQEEIAMMVAAAQSQLRLTWIPLAASAWEDTPLVKYQALADPSKPISLLTKPERLRRLANIAMQIRELAQATPEAPTSSSRRRRAGAEGPVDVEALAEGPFDGDRSVNNNASIAFLAEHQGKSLLICGDASADVLAESIQGLIRQRGLRRLRVDAMVVPHGGSSRNLHRQLLELLDCDRYLISTNGERYNHPDRETIARILAFGRTDRSVPLTLVFNYRSLTTAVWDDPELQQRWNYRAIYPQHEGGGIKVQI